MYFNETVVKIVLILLDSPHSYHTDVKPCFLILWFNCEFRVETDNEKYKQNAPTIHDIQFSKQNSVYSFFQRGKGTNVKTLEVCNVKALEVYNVKALEVYNVKALEVSYYQILTGGDILISPNIELM